MKENFILSKTKQRTNALRIVVTDFSEKELIPRKMPLLEGQESEII